MKRLILRLETSSPPPPPFPCVLHGVLCSVSGVSGVCKRFLVSGYNYQGETK